MRAPFRTLLAAPVLGVALLGAAAPATSPTDVLLQGSEARWEDVAGQIWDFAETALKETRSSALLESELEKEGFSVTRGVAGMPTAFVASAGSGSPVVGILAEYDALPGLSQVAGESRKDPRVAGAPGHGCGHNLLGTAAVAAAVAANHVRMERKLSGTIRVFGTPAEEQLTGKTFMARDGVFGGTDVILAWHPEPESYVYTKPRLAITAIDVEFYGKTAHAAVNPWLGRSSLDAVELFDHALALMREHVLPTARLHRVVKDGGLAANIIPDYARVQWYVRDATGASVDEMLGRIRKAAEGAALGTETRAKVTILASTREPIYNDVLSRVLQTELERVGAPAWDASDVEFAKALQTAAGVEPKGLAAAVLPYGPGHGSGASSDVGETSAVLPLAELAVAAGPAGAPWHHWGVTSCAAHPIGRKGMLTAAKVLSASLVDLLRDPAAVVAAKAEFLKATGGQPYLSPIPPEAKPTVY
jgi:aminobenzoyl-glutamate utilization protein B